MIIGIDGCFGSGKTLYARILKQKIPDAMIVHMDNYVIPGIEKYTLHSDIHTTDSSSIEWYDREKISQLKFESNTVYIVEGLFLLTVFPRTFFDQLFCIVEHENQNVKYIKRLRTYNSSLSKEEARALYDFHHKMWKLYLKKYRKNFDRYI